MRDHLRCYQTFPIWNKNTFSQQLIEQYEHPIGTTAELTILKGKIEIAILDEKESVIDNNSLSSESQPLLILPQQKYKVIFVSDDIECQLALYCTKEDYFSKKYELTTTHSEVVKVCDLVPAGKALDLGCGSGRNSLYLNSLGFHVDAVDKAEMSIAKIQNIIEQESLNNINANVYDIHQANLSGEYDLIISTVVMMFLQPERIPAIINNIQSITKPKGYNLIVSAMSTDDYPCTVPFSFTFKENELRNYYQSWNIIKYNENVGELHRKDANGNRIKLRFATLLAQK